MNKKEQWIAKLKEIGVAKLFLLLAAGIVLVLTSLPNKKTNYTELKTASIESKTMENLQQKKYREQMEEELARVLTQVKGIGSTRVMITLKGSKEIIVNKDIPFQESKMKEKDSAGGEREQSNNSKQEETVLVTDENGRNIPYVIKELEPEIAGIVVIAQGGDNDKVIKEITEACEVLFSVPVHKIKVMKMKEQQ